jgi:hypothetical protein
MQAPDKKEQILQTHASLVLAVVQTIHNAELKPHLDNILQQSAQNGWQGLVNIINKILDGNRDQSLINGLDDCKTPPLYPKQTSRVAMPHKQHLCLLD